MNKINPIILEILKNRGISKKEDILEFLSEKPSLTYDPFLLKNMEAGVDLILYSINQNKKICIYGDYDADGVTSTSLMLQLLSHLTQNLTYYIPSRFDEGYGLNKEAIDYIKEDGTNLIITVDCGSVSYDEIEYGKAVGLDFVVTDHHNINGTPSDCILINPKQVECQYPFKQLAGCGVAFKLAQAIQRKAKLPKRILTELLDLVAIATIGDIVPLIDENRTLTKYGIEIINRQGRSGLNSLIEGAGLTLGSITSENIAYVLVPHLNAAGRMMDAKVGVELLTSNDDMKTSSAVKNLIENNKERRNLQEEAFIKCKEIVENKHQEDLFLVIDAKDIHEGIAGIVAGKIKDEYRKPAIVVTTSGDGGYLKGTGRSIEGVNLYDLLKRHEGLFVKFGGHAGACGFLMKAEQLKELQTLLKLDMESIVCETPDLFELKLPIDVTIKGEELDISLALEIQKLAPFGYQNERPVIQINLIRPTKVFYMGDNRQHVRFVGAANGNIEFTCVLFQKAQNYREILQNSYDLNLAGYPDINNWKGNSKIQFVLKEITC